MGIVGSVKKKRLERKESFKDTPRGPVLGEGGITVPWAGLGSGASLHRCLRRCRQLLRTGRLLRAS